jgi:hypothetical protein
MKPVSTDAEKKKQKVRTVNTKERTKARVLKNQTLHRYGGFSCV